MSKNKKIVIAFIAIIFISYCNKSEPNQLTFNKYNTKEIIGQWKIIPSYNAKIVFDKNEKTYLVKENEIREIFALEDARGLRLYYRLEDDSPFAYFLFSEKATNIWAGILDNKVVRIVREGKISESILE